MFFKKEDLIEREQMTIFVCILLSLGRQKPP